MAVPHRPHRPHRVDTMCYFTLCMSSALSLFFWVCFVQWCSPRDQVLISRRLEDKNESRGLSLGSWSLGLGLRLEHLVLALVSVLKKILQFFKTFVVIFDDSEQGTPWHFVRDNKSSLPFGSHCLREPSALHAHQPQFRGYLTMGAIC